MQDTAPWFAWLGAEMWTIQWPTLSEHEVPGLPWDAAGGGLQGLVRCESRSVSWCCSLSWEGPEDTGSPDPRNECLRSPRLARPSAAALGEN